MSNNDPTSPSTKSKIPTISHKSSLPNSKKETQNPSRIEYILNETPDESQFPPRVKKPQEKKQYIIDETFPTTSKKGDFNSFLSKIEQFNKSKNDKIIQLQAIKKQQEDEELKKIPKVKMSEKSKKILEGKNNREKIQPAVSSAIQPPRLKSEKMLSYSSKRLLQKAKITEEIQFIENPRTKETPIQVKSEKVLASKFLKEFKKTFEEISKGNQEMTENETRQLMSHMLFIPEDTENLVKKEIQEKLFLKIWKITGSEEKNSVSIENLRTILLGIMNFFLPSMAHNQPGVQLGRIILEKLYLSQEEVLRIHKIFFPLYENRVNSLKKLSQSQKIEKFIKIQDSFRPAKKKESISKSFQKSEKKIIPENSFKNLRKVIDRSNCATPGSKKKNPNTSFRSARSRSRASGRSSIDESEIINPSDQIADPSILIKAQDILGIFTSTKKKTEEPKEIPKVSNEKIATEKKHEEKKEIPKVFNEKMASDQKNEDKKEITKIATDQKNEDKKEITKIATDQKNEDKKDLKKIDEGLRKVREILKDGMKFDQVDIGLNSYRDKGKPLQLIKRNFL